MLTAVNLSSPETEFQFWWSWYCSSSWLITECQPEPSGWNPVGALVSGASHYLCVDSQGCRRWVPVSKTAMSLSPIKSDDQNSGLCTGVPLYENSICRPESQLIEFSVGEYLQFKQRFLSSNFHLWKQKYKWWKSGIVQLSYMGME